MNRTKPDEFRGQRREAPGIPTRYTCIVILLSLALAACAAPPTPVLPPTPTRRPAPVAATSTPDLQQAVRSCLPAGRQAGDYATFIADITTPDGTVFPANRGYARKAWRVGNCGAVPWQGYRLKFGDGDSLGAPAEIIVPATEPGGTVDLALDFAVPLAPGRYQSYWQIVSPDGDPVPGGQLWLLFEVADPSVSRGEGSASATPEGGYGSGATLDVLQAELERVTAEELAHGCLAWDARLRQRIFCGESKTRVEALHERLQSERRKLAQPDPAAMAAVAAQIRALREDDSLEVTFEGVSGNPYSTTGRRMETYRDEQGTLYMVDQPARRVIQFGPGPNSPVISGEQLPSGVPVLSALQLRSQAEAYLARHAPGFEQVKQAFVYQESSKDGASYAFRWQSPIRPPGEDLRAFVQVVLVADGTIKSFNDTRALYEGER